MFTNIATSIPRLVFAFSEDVSNYCCSWRLPTAAAAAPGNKGLVENPQGFEAKPRDFSSSGIMKSADRMRS